ncbi:MAG: TIGR01440 family protein [Oscillospiraceae bacterium]|jgi:uncharacterized protein (TIGR01440 family)|nr:TIGR01440 family protein [Oscillospiraceae bacterium]
MLNEIAKQANAAITEFLETIPMKQGEILVIGCSSSEICGKRIGSGSSEETANAVFGAIYPILKEKGIYLAAQCCEHLNRAIILEAAAAEKYGLPMVNAVPQPKAGGSFGTAAYRAFEHPAAVERIQAHAGMDIGDTLIGMHLRPVAVPVRLSVKKIGEANLVCARTRPKYIGGERAHYDPKLG